MKRAHTVLKKSCWPLNRKMKEVTRQDPDGSMDYFVRLLCRVEASGYLNDAVESYQKESDEEIRKVQLEIEELESTNNSSSTLNDEINHLNNVIAVLLKGKQAADIYLSGDRVQAMEIMYGKGQTLKKVYKMDKAIEKL